MPAAVAYDPNNPIEQQFLSSLALGETGKAGGAYEGVGSTAANPIDLSGAPRDQYGFPQWSGVGNSHAAGPFQFEPGTWDKIAAQFGLNFSNPADQAAGAWYNAQQTDPSLYDQLAAGDYTDVQHALVGQWPSVSGNAAAPQGLAANLAAGIGALLPGGSMAAAGSAAVKAGGGAATGSTSLGFLGSLADVEQFFVRFGLVILGTIVVLVALWQLLSQATPIPSPGETAKAAGHAATEALAA